MTSPLPSTWQSIRALPRPAWALFAGTFINRFGGFVLVFLAFYLTQLGYSVTQIGAVLGVYGTGSTAAVLVGGHLADRFGRRATIALSMFSSAAMMLGLSQARSLMMITIVAGGAGLAADLYKPASAALVADLTPAGQRVTAFALYRLAVNAGFAAGPAMAGLLAHRSYSLLFVGDALTSVIFGCVALVALPAGRGIRHERTEGAGFLRTIVADRTMMHLVLAALIIAFVSEQGVSTFALHVRSVGLSGEVYGALLSLNGLLIIALELSIVSVTRRLPARFVLAAGLMCTGIGFGFTGVAHTIPALAITVVIWTMGEMLFSPVAVARAADLAPAHMRGRYQSAFGFTFSLGLVLAPVGGTALLALGGQLLWIVCFVLGVVATVFVLTAPERASSALGDTIGVEEGAS
ncbi:MAG TPA: MFS transporter [Gemmatimonadaceae bacterium]|nr:MFS transporter [Gemmatimonadaceae bacterium]